MTINPAKILELKELDDDGSDSVLKELIALFLASTPPKISKIAETFYLKDFLAARKESHSLRSSSLTLGADELSVAASAIEYAAEGPEMEKTMGDAVKKLHAEFPLVKAELEKYL